MGGVVGATIGGSIGGSVSLGLGTIPVATIGEISGYYSSIQKETDYMRVRDWLNGKSYEFQYEYGLEVLKRYGY